MHLAGLDLNLLIALDALLSERNVTRAAERMNISQPGMSAALQKLRWHFSDELLERVGRRLELTPRARTLAGPVKDILFAIKGLNATETQFDPATARHLFRVAASTFCSDLLAAPVIRRLAEIAPNVSCRFDDLQDDTLLRLLDGQVDCAITIFQGMLGDTMILDKPLSKAPLFTDRLVLVVAEDNKAIVDSIELDDLCDQPYAETRFGNSLTGVGERAWQQQPRQPRIRAWLPNFQLTLDTVSRTDLVAMVPSRLADVRRREARVRSLPIPFDVPALEEQIFWHPRNDTDPGHAWFRDLLRSVVCEEGLGCVQSNRNSSSIDAAIS